MSMITLYIFIEREREREILYGAQSLSRHILEQQTGQNLNFEIAITQSFVNLSL